MLRQGKYLVLVNASPIALRLCLSFVLREYNVLQAHLDKPDWFGSQPQKLICLPNTHFEFVCLT